uniref:Uncharacterized protein n=1 Tax=Anopheles minimus TaxID=112268 RepID=A0A182WPG2_9DIPT
NNRNPSSTPLVSFAGLRKASSLLPNEAFEPHCLRFLPRLIDP